MFQCKHGCQPNFVADANGHIHLVSQPENSNRVDQKAQCTEGLRPCCVACYQPRDTKTDLSVVTNKCCRYMFPISFAVFNLVYWLAFSTWKIKSIWCPLGGRSAELEVSWTSLRYFNLWGRKSINVRHNSESRRSANILRSEKHSYTCSFRNIFWTRNAWNSAIYTVKCKINEFQL